MSESPLVLIVDDVRDNREAYAEYLRFCGFRTTEAATGREALRESRRSHPDIVLLDMRLPDFGGLEVSRQIHRDGGERPRIIAISASVYPSDVAAALDSGCDSFLGKPCLPDEVVSEITRLLAH